MSAQVASADRAAAVKEIVGSAAQDSSVPEPSFRRLIEYSADGILVIDDDGTVRFANAAAAELFGCTVEELESVPFGRPAVSPNAADLVIRRLDGHPLRLEMRAVEVTWQGRPALLATLRDVSTQRILEGQFYEAQKLEAVGRLAAGVAHDFNNILAVVRAGINLVLKRGDGIDAQSEEILRELHARTEGGAALVKKLLTFSRQNELTAAPVDLNARITSLVGLLRATIGGHIRIDLELDQHLPVVVADASHIEAALVNLVVNSRDAIGERGTIRISTKLLPDGGIPRFRISVEDDGSGMSPSVRDKALEPFFTTKRAHGTGLGLSQVHGFAKQSGGELEIESALGRGTKISLILPVNGFRQEN